MANKSIEINYKTDTGYDILWPKTSVNDIVDEVNRHNLIVETGSRTGTGVVEGTFWEISIPKIRNIIMFIITEEEYLASLMPFDKKLLIQSSIIVKKYLLETEYRWDVFFSMPNKRGYSGYREVINEKGEEIEYRVGIEEDCKISYFSYGSVTNAREVFNKVNTNYFYLVVGY